MKKLLVIGCVVLGQRQQCTERALLQKLRWKNV